MRTRARACTVPRTRGEDTMATTKKTTKKAAKKSAATKAPVKKAAAKKAPAKKAPMAKKAASKKAPAKKAPMATKALAKKTLAKNTPVAKKAPAKKALTKKALTKKVAEPVEVMPAGEMLTMEAEIPASPEAIYDAWLDGVQHTAMTGAPAKSVAKVGGTFSAWDGYITGEYLALFPKERIVARWRTSEFPKDAPDSQLDVLFSAHRMDGAAGTRLFLIHTQLPPGGASKYAAGWAQFYFAPMTDHFGG
ncbi:MAG: histone H1-like repetitive region-containing protein [Deltaproteobacteria bacterium]|nr:histone H1-like repetitive region-containing protein [Deltaproteobacteria bacterium]